MQPEAEMGSMGFFFFLKYFSTGFCKLLFRREEINLWNKKHCAQNFVGRIYSALSAPGDHGTRPTRRKKSLELFLA